MIESNQSAPSFRLTAVGSGRVVQHPGLAAAALVLLFHDQNALATVRAVQEQVRGRYPTTAEAIIASVADLSRAPRLLRGVIEGFLRSAYAEASAHLPPGLEAADYVVILPDWKGEVTRAFGVDGADRQPAVVVIERSGQVTAAQQGGDVAAAALAGLAAAGLPDR